MGQDFHFGKEHFYFVVIEFIDHARYAHYITYIKESSDEQTI